MRFTLCCDKGMGQRVEKDMIEVQKTELPGLLLIQPKVFGDRRGSFVESYNANDWAAAGISFNFVQDNQSVSTFGVLRGLHYQRGEYAQTKVLRVAQGRILDVVVDLRPTSPTFQKVYSVELDDVRGLQILVPRQFAHGFIVLSETATIIYKCDAFYSPQHESGIHPLDPELNIRWPIPTDKILLSEKDKKLPSLAQVLKSRDWETQ